MARTTNNFGRCYCVGVEFGTYEQAVSMMAYDGKWVCIDSCIASEIAYLWHNGVRTLNSCCGHGKNHPSVIVEPDDYRKMELLGYKYRIAPSGLREYLLKTKKGRRWPTTI